MNHAPTRRRITAILLVLAVHVALFIILLRQAPPLSKPPPQLVTFQLIAIPQAASARGSTAKNKRASARSAAPRPSHVAVDATPPSAAPAHPLPFLVLSREEFAASDIAKLPSHRDDRAANGGDSSGAGDGHSSGSGEGPDGQPLYDADWYRRPTHAELSTYMPASAPRTGWGLIACQTVAHYHVDNCRELGEAPLGSGLARAVRQAAWQFLVLPPRIGGHPMIGAWVRIQIDYTEGAAR